VRADGRDETVRRWLPVLLWAGVIFAFSSIPSLGTGLGFWDLVLRKIAHAAEYAVLAVLLLRALESAAAAWALAVAYAVTDEVHQRFVSGRVGAPRDVLIDAAGAAAGLLAWRALARRARARTAA
jgi:VanZ family protein